ncbi:DUF4277 domain-containing protein [Paracoccus mutanolyticus]|uniref:DUF4277 domain-containing protein n=1 Tax=Paracoccus mutanolyticus TaxID=1499308 RepID=UPI0037C5DE97
MRDGTDCSRRYCRSSQHQERSSESPDGLERLIGPGICADDLNDDVLGRCLDALFEADVR